MYKPRFTNEFKKQLALMKKRGFKINLIENIMRELTHGNQLPPKNRDHFLVGEYVGCRECHIKPDWLLIYYYKDDEIIFVCTGSHSDLFD